MEIRNLAIIAHVDHGKTTLTDAIMSQCGHAGEGSMDSDRLEQERGITIYAKNTSVIYRGTKINLVDTPGHADFGSEVERVLRSVDSVLLVVDAQEGPMPQTSFVLKKSLELGLRPIVVINKIDKPAAEPERVHEQMLELFLALGAHDAQIDFPILYAVGRDGWAKKSLTDESRDLTPLLDAILKYVPPAQTKASAQASLQAQVFNLGYDNFLGRLAVARIYAGTIKTGQPVWVKGGEGKTFTGKISKLFTFDGQKRVEATEAAAGDIITLAGLPEIYIGETVTDDEATPPLPSITVDEPTISLQFLVNDSPFAGREGTRVTGRQIRERLTRELETNVGLKIDFSANDYFTVFGRGELHIAILLENMRREGYEVQVSKPEVIIKDGHEPFEELIIDLPSAYSGAVIEKLGRRRGVLTEMRSHGATTRLVFEIPTRGLLGYRQTFTIDTRGEGLMSSRVVGFRPHAGPIDRFETGSMVSMITGKALGFALWNLSERGQLYIEPATAVYEGMIIGNTAKGDDLAVNPGKGKQLTNMRASGSDEHIVLPPAYRLDIERGLELVRDGEYLEITPKSVRLRKKFLTAIDRARALRRADQ